MLNIKYALADYGINTQ